MKIYFQGAEIFCEALLDFVRGTGTDLYWRDNQTNISHEHYKQMAEKSKFKF